MLRIFLIFNFFFASFVFAKAEKAPVFSYPKELETAMEAAREAGSLLLKYWNKGSGLETATPVSIRSNEAICKKLLTAFPDYGLLTEEKVEGMEQALARWKEAEWTWVVDPLDGTESFLAGRKDFGVHIALLHFGTPVLGVNYYPVAKAMYLAVVKCGAYKQVRKRPLARIRAEDKPKAVRPIVASRKSSFVRSFYTALLGMPISEKMLRRDFRNVESRGLRLCMIAEGNRNIYASEGESGSLCDYASGIVILKEAGGFISDLEGKPLDFFSEDCKFSSGMLFCGSKALFEKAVKVSKK